MQPLIGKTSLAIKNSTGFIEFIKRQTILPDEVLVSFDVVSLFTNIPTDLALLTAKRRLEQDDSWTERTGLTIDDILRFLSLCLNATLVTFMEQHYQQVQGTAMGSPVSVVDADIVMETEQIALGIFPTRECFGDLPYNTLVLEEVCR